LGGVFRLQIAIHGSGANGISRKHEDILTLASNMMKPSYLSNAQPKPPRQKRGERRVAALLAAAAEVFAETGYRAATMSSIAEKAGAPIGSLYQFFPSKEAVAAGLLSRYLSEMSARWEELAERLPTMDLKEFSHELIRHQIEFFRERPAFTELIDATSLLSRPGLRSEARAIFTRNVQRFLQVFAPDIPIDRLRNIADVAVQLVKAANALSKHVSRRDIKVVMEEMEFVLNSYLENRLAAWRRSE
jgi:AcrR family transcriptional regulator